MYLSTATLTKLYVTDIVVNIHTTVSVLHKTSLVPCFKWFKINHKEKKAFPVTPEKSSAAASEVMKYRAVVRSEWILCPDKSTNVFSTAAKNPEIEHIVVKVTVKLVDRLYKHDMVGTKNKKRFLKKSYFKLTSPGGLLKMHLFD